MFRPGDLIVPLYNADGELVNIQLISGNGSKCFLKGGQVKEAYHLIEGGGSSVKKDLDCGRLRHGAYHSLFDRRSRHGGIFVGQLSFSEQRCP